MIRISDKALCSGCSACVNACPAQCIVPRRDREGFYYPVANADLCIECGKCEDVCPVLNPMAPQSPIVAYAARSEALMGGSSSGGIFPALAERFIDEGGIVYGAAFAADMTVEHIEVADKEGLKKIRGSKYVQSELYSAFEEVRDHLRSGRKVMFTGTPCQIAGLKKYLGNDTVGLFSVDIACHGVPSPGVWEKYVKELEQTRGCRLVSVDFRNKVRSWRHYDVVYYAEREGNVPLSWQFKADDDLFLSLFRQDVTLRPSCYDCPSRNGRSGSDLTLADLWSVAKSAPEMNDDKGVSLVLINSPQGLSRFEALTGIECQKVDAESARSENGGFAAAIPAPERRTVFFKGMHSADGFLKYMGGFVKKRPFYVKLYTLVRSALVEFKRKIAR